MHLTQHVNIETGLLHKLFKGFMDNIYTSMDEYSCYPEKENWHDAAKIASLLNVDITDTFLARYARKKGWK